MSQGFSRQQTPVKLAKRLTKAAEWQSQFSALEDPRGAQGVQHPFLSIVLIAILATIAGAQGWEDIELYAESHEEWLQPFLELPRGIPHADTYRRVFEQLDPAALERCFRNWVKQIVSASSAQAIPIDGKTARGSYDRHQGQSAMHCVSAWSSEHRLVLGPVKAESKTNEIQAITALLELLDLNGCIITIDAIGTQTEIARQVASQGSDYILALKGNQGKLHQATRHWFEPAETNGWPEDIVSFDDLVEAGHPRHERRQVWAVPVTVLGDLSRIQDWQGLQTLVMVKRVRHLWSQVTEEVMFYLTSLPPQASRLGSAIRSHWGIENSLPWVLGVTFGEDASRVRSGHAPENLALLRPFALGALNQEQSTKRSLHQKTKRAAMSPDYRLTVLAAALPV